jgi:hypothetical protein
MTALAYPLSLPASNIARISLGPRTASAPSESPFTFEQQIQVNQGGAWRGRIELPAMQRAVAEPWIGFLLALNGYEGTFYMGDPVNIAPQGTWAGAPLVHGASQSGLVLNVDGLLPYATGKTGDWFQLSSGSTSRLHKLTRDFTADSGGEATLNHWPRLRESPSDNSAIVTSSPKGVWRLASPVPFDWTLEPGGMYPAFGFDVMEAL